jgi:HlyD family secretion protein
MDRELDVSFRKGVLRRKVAWVVAGMALVAAILLFLPGWLRPSIAREQVRMGRVDRGPIEGIVEASGQVIPAFEGVLSSPVEARVQKILKRPGEVVKAGEEILRIDTSESRIAFERLEDQLRKKANEQAQLRINLEKSLTELRGKIESQKLDVEASRYRLEQNHKLRGDGLVSEQVLKASEVEAKKAKIELDQLQEKSANEHRATDAQLQGLELDLATLRRDRDEAKRQLELATTRSDRSGVLTWVVPQEGTTVRRGDVIARIADLDSFRVEATVSDVHSSALHTGAPVRVMLDGQPLSGHLAQVYPTIENGTVKFTVDLDDKRNPKLRNNLSVDVLVVTDSRANTLRVPKGPYAQGGAAVPVFVIQGDHAVRRTVRFGISGYEHFEVLEGLAEGDQVVLSDMRDYVHLSRVNLK